VNKFLKLYPKLHDFQPGDKVLIASKPLGDPNMLSYDGGKLVHRISPTEWKIILDNKTLYVIRDENSLVYVTE
jgi:hypothetical protein